MAKSPSHGSPDYDRLYWMFDEEGENLDYISGRGVLRSLYVLKDTKRVPLRLFCARTHLTKLTVQNLCQNGWIEDDCGDIMLGARGKEVMPLALAIIEGVRRAAKDSGRAYSGNRSEADK